MDKPTVVPFFDERKSPIVTPMMASRIKAMLKTGMCQHNIAAHFSINQGRVSEINTGMKFADVEPDQGDLFAQNTADRNRTNRASDLLEAKK